MTGIAEGIETDKDKEFNTQMQLPPLETISEIQVNVPRVDGVLKEQEIVIELLRLITCKASKEIELLVAFELMLVTGTIF